MTESPSVLVLPDDVDEEIGVNPAFSGSDSDHHRSSEDPVVEPDFPVVLAPVESLIPSHRRSPVAPVRVEVGRLLLGAQKQHFVTLRVLVPSPGGWRGVGGVKEIGRRAGWRRSGGVHRGKGGGSGGGGGEGELRGGARLVGDRRFRNHDAGWLWKCLRFWLSQKRKPSNRRFFVFTAILWESLLVEGRNHEKWRLRRHSLHFDG